MENGKWTIGLVATILIGLVLACGGMKQEGTQRTQTTQGTVNEPQASPAAETPVAKKAEPAKPEPSGSVTMATFNSLKTGMKYAEVVKILGSEGEVLSENEIAGIRTVMYKWNGAGWGSNMNAMFQNGKLISKSQFGLK